MSEQELIQALRCTSTPGGPIGDCEKCPFWKTENLTPEQSEQLGTDEWASCDIDRIGLEAADRLANQNTHIAALQKEIEKLRGQLKAYEDTGLTPAEIDMDYEAAEQLRQLCRGCDLARLEELAEADRDGRLVVLPCKVGNVVYGFHGEKTILPMVVKWIETCTNGWCIAVQYAQMAPRFYRFFDFGKTVFLTREEAEKALEGKQNE